MYDDLMARQAMDALIRSGHEVLRKDEYDRLMELKKRHSDLKPIVEFLKALEDRQIPLPYPVACLGVRAWDACLAAGLVETDGDK